MNKYKIIWEKINVLKNKENKDHINILDKNKWK